MKLFKKEQIEKKPVILANNNLDRWKHFDGKTLLDIDASENLVDVKLGTSANDIENLILEYADKKVAFPLSRGLSVDTDILNEEEVLISCQFNIRRKMVDGDEEGVPSGVEYISFGKPSGITFKEEHSLVPADSAVNS